MHASARKSGGYAISFRSATKRDALQKLEPAMLVLQRNLKQALDPAGVFGPRRLHDHF